MIAIIFMHTLGHSGAFDKFKYKKLHLFEDFCNWHINGFCLISGIIGYKTHKYSNILYLWLWVVFYSVGIHLYYQKYKRDNSVGVELMSDYCPVISNKYWYFTKYFGMYFFLPVINKGIDYLTKYELRITVISLHCIIVIWPQYKDKNFIKFGLDNGGSILWFILLYITGGYIGKYNIIYHGIKKYIYCLICLTIFVSTSLAKYNYYFHGVIFNNIKSYYLRKIIFFMNIFFASKNALVPRVLQTVSMALFTIQLDYNKYLAKIITFIAPLTFGIYLIHFHPIVKVAILSYLFRKDSNNLPVKIVIILILFRGVKIFIICLIIDYLRHIIFTFIRIKKICIFIEKKFL
jgi:hypothetical protein